MINPKAAPCDEATIRSIPLAANCIASQKPWVLLATILASSITYIDESVVNIALPAIERNLATSVAVIQWLVNAYTLCLSALLLTGGAAADRFGRRKMFIIGIILFAAASLWCGFAPSIAQLILARAMQGVGAAVLIPCSLALIGASFDEEERGKAIGTWAGVSAIAVAIGPLLGGLIVDHFSWRWIFLINPLLAMPTIWIVYNHVPESLGPEVTGRLDWTGAVLALLGLAGVCFGLIAAPDFGLTDIKVYRAACAWSGAALRFHLAGRSQRHPDVAARSVSVAHLLSRQSADIAALRRARRCILFSTIRADPGRRLFGGARRRCLPSLHDCHGIAVALVGWVGRPYRRQIAAHHWTHDHGAGLRRVGLMHWPGRLLDLSRCDDRPRPRHGRQASRRSRPPSSTQCRRIRPAWRPGSTTPSHHWQVCSRLPSLVQ